MHTSLLLPQLALPLTHRCELCLNLKCHFSKVIAQSGLPSRMKSHPTPESSSLVYVEKNQFPRTVSPPPHSSARHAKSDAKCSQKGVAFAICLKTNGGTLHENQPNRLHANEVEGGETCGRRKGGRYIGLLFRRTNECLFSARFFSSPFPSHGFCRQPGCSHEYSSKPARAVDGDYLPYIRSQAAVSSS